MHSLFRFNKAQKFYTSSLAALCIVCVSTVFTLAQLLLVIQVAYVWPKGISTVVFCDVGQGDAVLITQNFTQVMVDFGPSPTQAFTCLDRHIPWFDTRLEVAVATHPDFDHIGAFQPIMKQFFLSKLLLVQDAKTSDGFQAFREAVLSKEAQGTRLVFPVAGQKGQITNSVEYSVLSPQVTTDSNKAEDQLPSVFTSTLTETTLSDVLAQHEKHIKNYNDRSISLILTIDGVKIMLTGDIEATTERAIERSRMLTKVNILKVAHHGAKTSSTETFLAKVTPEQSIISAGKNNKYGHPANEVISRLEQVTSQIWRTDLQGEIRVQIQDGKYQITSERE